MSISEFEILVIDASGEDISQALDQYRRRLSPQGTVVSEAGRQKTMEVFGEPLTPQQVVERICEDVRQEGISAVLNYGEQLDHATLAKDALRVPAADLQIAHEKAESEFLTTIRRIRDNIREFQQTLLLQDSVLRRPGVELRQRFTPLQRVGICVPGGAAAYPSTVLMTAVPALAAGVDEIAIIAPPTSFGAYNEDILATCHELGVHEVYRVGGAQGVAMLAYGVEGVVAVDKIVGPGNLFVALAKKYVYGEVDIDSIAGPSEVVVLADGSARADFVAADMLAQAEHAPGASILVTWECAFLDEVRSELRRQVSKLTREEQTLQSLRDFGALILVADANQGCQVTNLIAPEHLHIVAEKADELLDQIHNAGATFLGNYAPVAIGDYVAGPSHVLPTGGTARWASGLTANDFLRGGSVIRYDRSALESVLEDVRTMADKERLTAHRASVDIRFRSAE